MIAPPDKDAIPEPLDFQVYRKPYGRMNRKHVRHFEILPYIPPPSEPVEGEETAEPAPEPEVTEGEEGGKAVVEKAPYRWVLEPYGEVKFIVRFTSQKEGRFESHLTFETVGTGSEFTLHCLGHCEIPSVNGNPQNLFMRRVKGAVPNAPKPKKRYVQNENYYSFGPLLKFKEADW